MYLLGRLLSGSSAPRSIESLGEGPGDLVEPGLTPDRFEGRPWDAILLDGVRPGSGRAFDWSAAEAWRGWPRLVLAGGLRPDTVAAAIDALRPYAVDVATGVEAAWVNNCFFR